MDKFSFDVTIYKAAGALLGAVAGLIYIKPTSVRNAFERTVVSVICGFAFYFVPIKLFNWEVSNDHILGGSLLMAFAAWPLAGYALKWLSNKTR